MSGDTRPPLLHLVEGDEPVLTAAHKRLAERFRVLLLVMNEPEGLALALEQQRFDRFNLLATGRASRQALALARDLGERVLALVLESPEAPGDDTPATPTLVLLGTRDDSGTPAAGRACAQRIPGAHLVFVYDAGHAISTDRPEAFADVVADFFERHEAFVISRSTTVIHP
jgi:pimeloyl-ACP methyl ester carboxylesterase